MIREEMWARYRSWCLANDLAPSTATKAVRYLRFFEREHGVDLSPRSLTQDCVLDLLASARARGLKPKTLNNWARELNLWARFHQLPWKLAYFRRRTNPIVRVPDEKVVRALRRLTWSNPTTSARNRAIIALLADMGPRRNEIIHLDLADLHLNDDGTPMVRVRFGKGEKERELFIDPSTHELLQLYIERYRIHSDSRALFTTPRGRISYAYIARVVKDAGARVGAPWISAHKIRHYVCDSLLDAGVSVPSVAQVLGHEHWETTALYRSKRLTVVRAEKEVRAASRARFGAQQ